MRMIKVNLKRPGLTVKYNVVKMIKVNLKRALSNGKLYYFKS